MKKKNIINLIKYYSEHNDIAFRNEAYEIAKEFDNAKDHQLAEYIMALLSDVNTFTPQIYEETSMYMKPTAYRTEALPLPDMIKESILGILNAVGHNAGVNKFLFQGPPGTGKTEAAKQIAKILDRELLIVDFDAIVDSKLGQTSKNLAQLFEEINRSRNPEKLLVLFDEIDALALDRTNRNDLREMGRATSSMLKGLDGLHERVLLIATTNLYPAFDKALIRRFDSVIDFSLYTREDLLEIAEIILSDLLLKFKAAGRNMRLFRKIIKVLDPLPYPGDIKNLLKTALAFSNPTEELDYLRRLYITVSKETPPYDYKTLQDKGFSLREIEILTGVSKSQLSRELKE